MKEFVFETELEIWKDVDNYEGIYKISNLGRLKSLSRKIKHVRGDNHFYQHRKEKIISANKKRNGYLEYSLYKQSKRNHFYAHRLVAKAFVDNPNNFSNVNHIDENKENNTPENLEWCTTAYNNTYGTRMERKVKNSDYRKSSRKIIGEKDGIRIVFYSVVFAVKITNTNLSSVRDVLSGKIKKVKGWYFYDTK